MGIRDKIREMLGGDAVSGFAPDDDDDDEGPEGDQADEAEAIANVRTDIQTNEMDAFDRIHRMPGSDTEIRR